MFVRPFRRVRSPIDSGWGVPGLQRVGLQRLGTLAAQGVGGRRTQLQGRVIFHLEQEAR